MTFPEGAVILHGYEPAFVSYDGKQTVYDYHACLKCLIDDGCSEDGAVDYFHYNTIGARACYPDVFFRGWDDQPSEDG